MPLIIHVALSAPAANTESKYPLETCGIGVVESGDPHKVKWNVYGLLAVAAALVSAHRKCAEVFACTVDPSGMIVPPVVYACNAHAGAIGDVTGIV